MNKSFTQEQLAAMTVEQLAALGINRDGTSLVAPTAKPGFWQSTSKYFYGAGLFLLGIGTGYVGTTYANGRKSGDDMAS